MKRILFSGCALMCSLLLQAQQKQGTIIYDRSAQMKMRMNQGNGDEEHTEMRSDKFELDFANNQSVWKQAEKEPETDNGSDGGGGMQIHMIVAGSDDILFYDLSSGKETQQREFFGKTFIVDDSVHNLNWKISDETKQVLNHTCRKATTVSVSTRTRMTINNGVMEKKDVQDTSNITAWFAADIPVSAGPAEYQGQLPGLILALDINNGNTVYVATSISEKTNLSAIKAPTGKKHYTPAEMKAERDKMLGDMQKNNQGGNRQIRIN